MQQTRLYSESIRRMSGAPRLSIAPSPIFRTSMHKVNKMDSFKTAFKYFRKKSPKPDLSDVIDFDSESSSTLIQRISIGNPTIKNCEECEALGLHSHNTWKIYRIAEKNGFIFIKNPFTVDGQRRWIRNSLEYYTRKPSVTNLDAHYDDADDIWRLQWSTDLVKRSYLSKLRWATFGYHHNWDTKVYSSDHMCAFPHCLKTLSLHLACCLDCPDYSPEAAIVNFYHMDSSLGGHVDCSEIDRTAPIISLSYGQTAIFLLGGKTKSIKPCAMFLRSGDIVVMGGHCRLAYHAMPLIIKEDLIGRCEHDNSECCDWKPFAEYVKSSRININIRQVFPQ